jgi:hypothetical protein
MECEQEALRTMSNTYSVRMYESTDGRNSTSAGTIVALSAHILTFYAYTAGEVETSIRRRVLKRTLPFGKVYQICPCFGNSELVRSIAVLSDGSFERVFLDPAQESYGEFRRIRLANTARTRETESVRDTTQDLESLKHGLWEQIPVEPSETEREKMKSA